MTDRNVHPTIMNLNQVTVPSLNVEASIAFYEALGLKLIVDSSPRYARLECPDGEATFSIHHVEKSTGTIQSGSHGVYVYFETENLDSEVERLVAAGIEFEHLPIDQTWLWREARLKDPDGNQIILFHGGENRKNPPWRINPDQ